MSMALVLAFGIVLLVSVSLSGVVARTILSTALLFLAAGGLLGEGGFGLVEIPSNSPFVTGLADLALFTVLFTDGQRAGLPPLIR
jgi:NhaP-type Na+/H+ and K+/H+ antiporter